MVPLSWIMATMLTNNNDIAKNTLFKTYLSTAIVITILNIALAKKQHHRATSRLMLYFTSIICGILFFGLLTFPSYFLDAGMGDYNLALPIYTLAWIAFATIHSIKFFPRHKSAADLIANKYQSDKEVSIFEVVYTTSHHEDYLINQINKNTAGIAFSIFLVISLIAGLNLRKVYPTFSAYATATSMSFFIACLFEILIMNIYFTLAFIRAERKLNCKIPPLFLSQKERHSIIKKFKRS